MAAAFGVHVDLKDSPSLTPKMQVHRRRAGSRRKKQPKAVMAQAEKTSERFSLYAESPAHLIPSGTR
uniref:Uncharacterized protein n=1 Tax=Oryza glumipatula TaxID=40148 RepID=A0A0D9ZJ15_9ORYZ